MSFKIGDRVGYKRDSLRYVTSYRVGQIDDVTSSGRLIVKWDGYSYLNNYTIDPSDLILESELKEKLSVLEIEFNQVQEKVLEKVKIATDAIAEAQQLAESIKMSVKEMDESLIDAIGSAGWNVSSLSC